MTSHFVLTMFLLVQRYPQFQLPIDCVKNISELEIIKYEIMMYCSLKRLLVCLSQYN